MEQRDQAELDELAGEVAELVQSGLGPRSRWALDTAIRARHKDGVAGILVIKIPPRSKDFVDVDFVVGTCDLINRWGA